MLRILFFAVAATFFALEPSLAQDNFDCPAMCEQGTRQALEKCRKNHSANPSQCPSDDGRIPEECRRVCAELSNLSMEELQKKLPSNYKDVLEGK